MLPASNRLKEDWEIRKVYRSKLSRVSRSFVLNWRKNNNNTLRFAFVASKKVGNAVQRNRGVRLLRESVKRNLSHFPSGMDFVVVARAGIIGKKLQQIEDEFSELLSRDFNKR